VENHYVFYWGFNASFISPLLTGLNFELQIDSAPSFDTIDLSSFDKLTAINFQNGDVLKGFEIEVNSRVDKTEQTWYARVRTLNTYIPNFTSQTDPLNISLYEVDTFNGEHLTTTAPQVYTLPTPTITSDVRGYAVFHAAGSTGTLTVNTITIPVGQGQMFRWNTITLAWEVVFPFFVYITDPVSPSSGDIWFNTTDNAFKTYDGVSISLLAGVSTSAWSFTIPFVIPQKWEVEEAENLLDNLPDYHVYNKEDLRKPVAQRNTNLYMFMNMYGKELDQTKLENYLTTTNIYLDFCRDEALFDNFGDLFNYPKTVLQEHIEYRESLRAMISGSLAGSTVEAVSGVIRSFTGVDPDIRLIRAFNDFYLNTIQDVPTVPGGPQTVFTTSEPYIAGSLVVEDITSGLLVSSGAYTENPGAGSWAMIAPTSDTLQAMFDIGQTGDPVPLVFDIADTTALTGTVTFTHGSTSVTGVGTLFTTELAVGKEITDAQGLILGTVLAINNNLSLVLTEPWIGITSSGSATKLRYTNLQVPPSILWDRRSLAHGIVMHVFNPGQFALPTDLIESLVDKLLPSHVLRFYQFE
jgi:hypothetical protein